MSKKLFYTSITAFLLFLALFLFSCGVSGEGVEVTVTTIGTVQGLVTDAKSGEPLFGAMVIAGGKVTFSFATGQYTIEDIQTGDQIVMATIAGYKPYQAVFSIIQGSQIFNIQMTPEDKTPPNVVSVSPKADAIGVPTNAKITATFDEEIDPATINGGTFIVSDPSMDIPGNVTYDEKLFKATFVPNPPPLAESTQFFVTITTGVKDLQGNTLLESVAWKFTTGVGPGDTTNPNPPPSLTATAVSASRIDLLWTASDSTDVEGYIISRDSVDIASVPSTPPYTYSDEGLSPDTPYNYGVRAVDTAGNESDSATAAARTFVLDSIPPANVTGFAATSGDGQVTLSWMNPADADFEGVWLLRKTGGYPSGPNDTSAVGIYKGSGTQYTDTGLTNGTTYYYAIYSFDGVPNFSSGVNAAATPQKPQDVTPPGEVANLSAVPGNAQVSLSWTNPLDKDLAGIYIVFKTTGFPTSYKDGSLIYKDIGTSFIHGGLTNGITYYYGVYTFDTSGNISKGVTASAVPVEPTSTLTLTAIADAFIDEGNADSNYGIKIDYLVSGSKELSIFSLIKFDLGKLDGKKVIKATLRLNYFSSLDKNDEYFHVHRIIGDWKEDVVTWTSMMGKIQYIDLKQVWAETRLTAGKYGAYDWDVTNLVSSWVSDPKNYPNYGLALKKTYKSMFDHYFMFRSREYTVAPKEIPMLIVEYR